MSWLWTKARNWVICAGLLAIAMLAALIEGFRVGERSSANKAAQDAIKGARVANEQESNVIKLPSGEAQKKLKDKWSRP